MATEGIVASSDRAPGFVAALEGIAFDVEGLSRDGLVNRECQTSSDVVLIGRDTFGYLIASGPQDADFFGVGRCQVPRVWVFETGGFPLTIIGGTADPARHAEAVAKIEELFEGMSFEVP